MCLSHNLLLVLHGSGFSVALFSVLTIELKYSLYTASGLHCYFIGCSSCYRLQIKMCKMRTFTAEKFDHLPHGCNAKNADLPACLVCDLSMLFGHGSNLILLYVEVCCLTRNCKFDLEKIRYGWTSVWFQTVPYCNDCRFSWLYHYCLCYGIWRCPSSVSGTILWLCNGRVLSGQWQACSYHLWWLVKTGCCLSTGNH